MGFPSSSKSTHHLGDAAVLKFLQQDMQSSYTVHGFRSSFRDWCAETANYEFELAEKALSHNLKSRVQRAYQRGDMLEKRHKMMQEWADYIHRNRR